MKSKKKREITEEETVELAKSLTVADLRVNQAQINLDNAIDVQSSIENKLVEAAKGEDLCIQLPNNISIVVYPNLCPPRVQTVKSIK